MSRSIFDDGDSFERLVAAGENVCLTGPGGTGKSFRTRRMIARDPGRFAVTASTGIAALNIGGLTLHRWSGMMLGPQNGETDEAYLEHLLADKRFSVRAGFDRIRGAQTLVIDEVSMLNGRTLDFLDFLCRRLRGDHRPFGGVQMIVTGDFLQLPPVKKDPRAPYDWAFESRAWRDANFHVVHLTKVHRQEDAAFVGALSDFRFGRVEGHNARLLRSRVAKFPDANLTRLFTHNAQVDKWNAYRLSYALTIHKSQGVTLDSAYIDVRAAREPGQAYVALSRLRELSGLHLKDWFSGVFVSRAAVDFYRHAA